MSWCRHFFACFIKSMADPLHASLMWLINVVHCARIFWIVFSLKFGLVFLLIFCAWNRLNFQLLVDWTRGKNLIISTVAHIVYKQRRPLDVANLSFFLGLSMEQAKAALSKYCRNGYFHKAHSHVDLMFDNPKF